MFPPNTLINESKTREVLRISFSTQVTKTHWREIPMGSICIRHTTPSLPTSADHSLDNDDDDDDVIYTEAMPGTWTPTTTDYHGDLIYS